MVDNKAPRAYIRPICWMWTVRSLRFEEVRVLRRTATILAMAILAFTFATSVSQAKRSTKPLKAYITGARIAIVEGRPEEAIILLDTIAINHGPIPEAIDLRAKVYVDKLDNAAGPEAMRPFVELMVAYIDSLHIACENEDVNKKYRKKCDKYLELADSTKVKYFRQFYSFGLDQLRAIENLADALANEADSSRQAYLKSDIAANIDSVIMNMGMALVIDSTDYSPYVAIGDAYAKQGDYVKSGEWMQKGYEKANDPSKLLLPLAFNYVKIDDYCGAIRFYKEYLVGNPTDTMTLFYLSICFNNCSLSEGNAQFADSAMVVYRRLLQLDPSYIDALIGGGRYFIMRARHYSDSAAFYRDLENTDVGAQFDIKRNAMFDSARAYYKIASDAYPDGFTSALLQDCPSAVLGFEKVAAARPDEADNWISLGDCYLQMGQWTDALRAYERVSELEPDRHQIWENLEALYTELGDKAKAAEAGKKAAALKGN